jgi:hypothetical protein
LQYQKIAHLKTYKTPGMLSSIKAGETIQEVFIPKQTNTFLKQMNTLKANTNKPWMSSEYDIPVLDNEEMWSQEVIDTTAKYLLNDIEKDEK